ncbi:unnamed protein product (macronuclear) [Paramecium tetraurelia]|uniref:Transmembrane protein n=1 Tax=Paramecium tetraurelia TaxID=5888 RepID=A0BPU9_PARTE|nr:uncharacterized protein GSPATT00005316001 [Paramecium tetraurelia]CAK60566.1 unnamed protein product [Paramecium tetraurelia]|eukprot:XP_001427964.1 hypothetical protein (macronuclear) [Paramecium tetraurelia strain d4-2]
MYHQSICLRLKQMKTMNTTLSSSEDVQFSIKLHYHFRIMKKINFIIFPSYLMKKAQNKLQFSLMKNLIRSKNTIILSNYNQLHKPMIKEKVKCLLNYQKYTKSQTQSQRIQSRSTSQSVIYVFTQYSELFIAPKANDNQTRIIVDKIRVLYKIITFIKNKKFGQFYSSLFFE